MCQKIDLMKRMFVVLRHSNTPQPHVWNIIPPLTQAEEIYKVHSKTPGFLTKNELSCLFTNSIEESNYSMIPLELPANWFQRLPNVPLRLR
jgi:hypothetical protein